MYTADAQQKTESSLSPCRKKVLGRMRWGKSPSSMLSHKQAKQVFQGPKSNKVLITAHTASQEKQHKERLEHNRKMQKMICYKMLKIISASNAEPGCHADADADGSVTWSCLGCSCCSRQVADSSSSSISCFIVCCVSSSPWASLPRAKVWTAKQEGLLAWSRLSLIWLLGAAATAGGSSSSRGNGMGLALGERLEGPGYL